jgi:hypothetical protein
LGPARATPKLRLKAKAEIVKKRPKRGIMVNSLFFGLAGIATVSNTVLIQLGRQKYDFTFL